jgi:hypothetical protein
MTQEDYRTLYGGLVSDDPTERATAQKIAATLRPNEQHEFFVFQQALNKGKDFDATRADTAIARGVPLIGSIRPEDLLVGTQAVRAIAGAAGSSGVRGRH